MITRPEVTQLSLKCATVSSVVAVYLLNYVTTAKARHRSRLSFNHIHNGDTKYTAIAASRLATDARTRRSAAQARDNTAWRAIVSVIIVDRCRADRASSGSAKGRAVAAVPLRRDNRCGEVNGPNGDAPAAH